MRQLLLATILLVCGADTLAHADEPPAPAPPSPPIADDSSASKPTSEAASSNGDADPIEEEMQLDFGAAPPESVEGDLDEAAQGSNAGLLPEGPITFLYNLWKPWNDHLDDTIGLRLGLAFTAVYQHAFASEGFRDAAGFDADFYGKWRLIGGKDSLDKGYLGFYTEYRGELFEPVPARLGPEIGSAWNTVDGFNEQDFALTQLYWEQHLFEDHVVASIGKIKADNFYSTNRASNDNLLFLNRSFSSNPALRYPGAGLGVNLRFQTELWYVAGGFQDAQGKKTTSGFNTFGDGEFFYAGEFGLTPTFEGLGLGNYRFTYWYSSEITNTNAPAAQGFALSFDQELIPDTFGVFLRYATSDDFQGGIENIVSAGVLGKIIPSRKDDGVGVAISWGEPTDGARDQWASEIFYRIQLGTREQLTFGMQFITDPSYFPEQDLVEVFEARIRIAF